jgi:hypothetical protein
VISLYETYRLAQRDVSYVVFGEGKSAQVELEESALCIIVPSYMLPRLHAGLHVTGVSELPQGDYQCTHKKHLWACSRSPLENLTIGKQAELVSSRILSGDPPTHHQLVAHALRVQVGSRRDAVLQANCRPHRHLAGTASASGSGCQAWSTAPGFPRLQPRCQSAGPQDVIPTKSLTTKLETRPFFYLGGSQPGSAPRVSCTKSC